MLIQKYCVDTLFFLRVKEFPLCVLFKKKTVSKNIDRQNRIKKGK